MLKVPKTDSVEELAKFWDTHDITDFENELEDVKETVFDLGGEAVARIHLDAEQAEALNRIARCRGDGRGRPRRGMGERETASLVMPIA